nr:hypothetical protein [Rhodococcus sp. (in: high G+C Gram-positive bacteria)]
MTVSLAKAPTLHTLHRDPEMRAWFAADWSRCNAVADNYHRAKVTVSFVSYALVESEVDTEEHYLDEAAAMADALAWFAEEGWTLEADPEGGFYAVEDGVRVLACLVKPLMP